MSWIALLVIPAAAIGLRSGPSPSRRLLACVLTLLIPIAGLVLAVLVLRIRAGALALEPVTERPLRRMSSGDVARLGEMPPALDRVLAGDPGERLEALVRLSSAGDANAVEVLRWAIEHGSSDAVLDAALTLEEIDLRGEARLVAAREALIARSDVDRALAAADAAAARVLNRLADPTVHAGLAAQARAWYQVAREHAPEHGAAIDEKVARLELAVGRPAAALEILDRLVAGGGDLANLENLRDDAAFAARVFDVLRFTPCALDVPPDLAACKLHSLRA